MTTFGVGDQGETIHKIQNHLSDLGFDPGAKDGVFGPKTRRAVTKFQQWYLVTGVVDPYTHAKIKQEWRNMSLPVPNGLAEIEAAFGKIEWEAAEGGSIVITNDWADDYLVTTALPVVGKTAINKKLAGVFRDVLAEVEAQGLAEEIKQWGVWSPRHKMHDPARGLSTHSWAIACDINWAENPVGRVGKMDPRIVQIFEARGFNWGGRWRTRDDMHFQYCRGY